MATTLQSLPALTPPAAPTLALAQDEEATATGSQSAMPRSPQVASPLDADQDPPPRPSPMVPSRSSSIRSSARSKPASPALALQQLPLEPSPPHDSTISPPPGISSDEAEGDTTPDSSSPPTPPSRPRPRPQSLGFVSKAPSLSHPQDQLYTASAQRRSPPRRGSALCSLQAAAASVAAAAASAAESTSSGGGSAYSTSFSANTLPSLSSSKSLSRATTISSPPRYHLQQQQQQQQQQQRHHHPGLASSPTSPPPADYYIRKRTQSTTLPELRRSRTLHTTAPTTSHYTSLEEAAAAAAAAATSGSSTAGSPPFGRGYDQQQTHASTLRARGRRLSSTTVAGLPSAESKMSIRDRTPLSRAGDVGASSSSTISRRDGTQRLTAPAAAAEDTSTTPTPRPLTNLEAKVVILGAQGVGKTSIVHRYTSGHFSSTSSVPSTIGASFLTKKLVVNNVKCRLQIWDTAGQERYRAMAPMYYRNAHAAVLVYDVTSRESLGEVRLWVEELRRNVGLEGEDGEGNGGGLVLHVVGAKADLAERGREVTLEEAREQLLRWLVPERQRVVDALEEEREQLAVQQAVADAAAAAGGGSMPTSATMSRLSSLSSLAMGTAASRLGVAFPSVTNSGGGTGANNASTSSLPLGGGGGSSSKRPTFSRFPTNTSTSNVAAAADSSLITTGAGSGGGPASSDGSNEGGASDSILPGLPPLPTPNLGLASSSSPPLAQSSYFAANHSSSSIHAHPPVPPASAAAAIRLPGDNLDLLLSEVSAKDDSPEALCAIEEVFVSITERLVHRRGLEMQRLREMRRRDSIFLGGEEGEDEDEEEGVEGQMGSRRGGGRAGSSIRSKKGENGWSCC